MPRKEKIIPVWKEKLPRFNTEKEALMFARQAVGSVGVSKVVIDGRLARIFGQSIHYEDEKPLGHVVLSSENFSEDKEKAWELAIQRLNSKPRRKSAVPYSVEYFQESMQN